MADTDRSFIPNVLRAHYDGGGRVVDTSALYGASEANVVEVEAPIRVVASDDHHQRLPGQHDTWKDRRK